MAVTVIGIAALPVPLGARVVGWIVGKVRPSTAASARAVRAGRHREPSGVEHGRSVHRVRGDHDRPDTTPLLGVVLRAPTYVLGLGAATSAFGRGHPRGNSLTVRAPRETSSAPGRRPRTGPRHRSGGARRAPRRMPRQIAGVWRCRSRRRTARRSASSSRCHASTCLRRRRAWPSTQARPNRRLEPPALLAYRRASFGERAAAFALDVLLDGHAGRHERRPRSGRRRRAKPPAYHDAFWRWKATARRDHLSVAGGALDGARLRFVDTLVRGLVGVFSLATFGLGALGILRHPERQSWHDKVSGTIVVRVPTQPPLKRPGQRKMLECRTQVSRQKGEFRGFSLRGI